MLSIDLHFLEHPVVPLITFALGVVSGHYTALWRDRRKERNEALVPLREFLLAERHKPSLVRARPTLLQFDLAYHALGPDDAGRLRRAWQHYEDTCEQQKSKPDGMGQRKYRDLDAIRKAADACLSLVVRR